MSPWSGALDTGQAGFYCLFFSLSFSQLGLVMCDANQIYHILHDDINMFIYHIDCGFTTDSQD